MTFHVGQKVVCVDASNGHIKIMNDSLRLNAIYEVREIDSEYPSFPGIRLVELRFPTILFSDRFPAEPSFRIERFRPIVSRKTDISIFTKMLTPQGVDA